jgi:hypothetical protein
MYKEFGLYVTTPSTVPCGRVAAQAIVGHGQSDTSVQPTKKFQLLFLFSQCVRYLVVSLGSNIKIMQKQKLAQQPG